LKVVLTIAIEAREDVLLVRLTGELAMESTVYLREATAPLHRDERPLVIEASDLAFVDSTGIAELCALAASRGRPIGVLAPQHVVRNVLTLLDLAVLLPEIEGIDEEALARLRAPLGR
jgi:anti-anti-sigma factor